LKTFRQSLFYSLYIGDMLDPRGIEGAVDSTEEEVAMDTSSVQSEGSERESAVQPQVGQSTLLSSLIFVSVGSLEFKHLSRL